MAGGQGSHHLCRRLEAFCKSEWYCADGEKKTGYVSRWCPACTRGPSSECREFHAWSGDLTTRRVQRDICSCPGAGQCLAKFTVKTSAFTCPAGPDHFLFLYEQPSLKGYKVRNKTSVENKKR